jgi:hypothetical protein
MAPAVHVEVTFDGLGPIGFRRDDRNGAAVVQFGTQPIHIEGFVGEQGLKVDARDQRCDTDTVVTLARHQDEARKIAQRIDQRQDFGRQAAARSTDGLILSPPFAPVPCWWTRMIVPSIIAYSKSGSPDKLLKILSKTPFCAQRRKRLKVEFQHPNSWCRSRQGDPVRTIHKIASRKSRLFAPLRPGSPGFPGRTGATRSHCASFKTVRSKVALHWGALKQNPHVRGIPKVNHKCPQILEHFQNECVYPACRM